MKLKFIIAAVVVAVLAVLVISTVSYNKEDTHYSCVVTDKDRTRDSEGNTDTRVYTKNCGTFTVTDSLLKGKFNSADTFGSLEEGGTYNFTTVGFRNGFLSAFPNIIEVEPASEPFKE